MIGTKNTKPVFNQISVGYFALGGLEYGSNYALYRQFNMQPKQRVIYITQRFQEIGKTGSICS